MGKYKGLNISGGLAANFKKLKVRKTIALTELLDRGHVYEGRSDLPTKGAAHRRGRGAEKSNRKGARGATRGSVDLGYVSGDGSNVVVNEDFGLLTENAVPLGQAIKETRKQQGIIDSQAEASITPPAPAVSGTIFQVTVGPKTGGGNAFYINGVEAPALTIVKPGSYIFSQVDPSNVGHPLRFSLDGGVTEFTDGVTAHGTIGTVNSYVHIVVGANDDITGLSYYCTVHGQGMGNTIAEGSEVWTPPSTSEGTGGTTGTTNNYTISTLSVNQAPTYNSGDIGFVPYGFTWVNNGTGVYVISASTHNAKFYDVTTAYDLSTGTLNNSKSYDSNDLYQIWTASNSGYSYVDIYGHGSMEFNADGTEVTFMENNQTTTTYFSTWSLNTAWDMTSIDVTGPVHEATLDISSTDFASLVQSQTGIDPVSPNNGFSTLWYFTFNDDGTKLLLGTGTRGIAMVYEMPTAYDISSITWYGTGHNLLSAYQFAENHPVNTYDANIQTTDNVVGSGTPKDYQFNSTGTKLYISLTDGFGKSNIIVEYNLGTAWDLSTISDTDYTILYWEAGILMKDKRIRGFSVTPTGNLYVGCEEDHTVDPILTNDWVAGWTFAPQSSQHALYSSADLLVHYDFTDSTTTAGYISGSSVTDQQGNHNAVINTYNSATPTYEDGGLRTNSGTIIAGDWSMGTYPSHTAIIVTKYIGSHRAVMGAYDPPATDPSGYGKGFSIGKDDIFGRFDNGATYRAAEFTDLTAVGNNETFVLGYVVDGDNNTIYGWRNGEKSVNTITLNSAITAPVFNTYEYGGVFAGGSSGYSTAAQYMTDSVIYKTFFFGRVLTDQEMSEFMDSLLEETIPQVTALQGSMTVGDTATIETNGVSKFTPTENFTATVKMWGAAGGNGTNSFGGRGGYTEGTFEFQAGTTYQILVGQGGKSNNGTSGGVDTRVGGGGRVGVTANANDFRATGGGYTGLFDTTILQSNALLIAGGGGGGGPTGYPSTDANAGGGDGGGTSGTNGSNGGFSGGGQGGTQIAGGAKGTDAGSYGSTVEAGSALLGGGGKATITENYSGSGGGGGYFGGGGGGSNNYAGGAGGGGSSYIHTSITNGQTISGADLDNKTGTERGTVPGSTETEWNGTAGSQSATKAKEGEAPDGQITITVIDPNAQPSSSSWYGDRAWSAGGDNAAYNNVIYLNIPTQSNSTQATGIFSYAASVGFQASGVSGATCLVIGGSDTGANSIEDIRQFNSVTLGSSVSHGSLSSVFTGGEDGFMNNGSLSDGDRCVFQAGYDYQTGVTNKTTIGYVGIQTQEDASDFGELTQGRRGTASTNDDTRGLFIGGEPTSGSGSNTIDYITIQSAGAATDFDDYTHAIRRPASSSNGTIALVTGGRYAGSTATLYTDYCGYVTIQTPGAAQSFGNLNEGRRNHMCSSDGTYAVTWGGRASSGNSTQSEYHVFDTLGSATAFSETSNYVLYEGGHGSAAAS